MSDAAFTIASLAELTRMARVYEYTQMPYAEALALQRRLVDERLEGHSVEDAIILLEHPPTYTLGRNANPANILLSPERCRERGIEVVQTDRGGDVTYHGPGQLVVYPIVDLRHWKRDVGAYVRALEEMIIRALADFGIHAQRGQSTRGVWAGPAKIASVGVRIHRWVSMHGVALNINADLSHFEGINPCGAPGALMTTMVHEGFDPQRQDEVREAVLAHFARIFGRVLAREADIAPGRRPGWLKATLPTGRRGLAVRQILETQRLHTVCSSARCPNLGECWNHGTATFMINGDICTRSCSFCAVLTGRPRPLDPEEPRRVAEAAAAMGLEHVVVTAVNRDELPDGGAAQFAAVIRALRQRLPNATVEVLVPDFKGDPMALRTVFEARPDVLNHNIETVPRLYKAVRPQARYERSIEVIRAAAEAGLLAKSGLMLGLGERKSEIAEALRDLRAAGCRIVTIGQYLRPSAKHHPVIRYVHPDEFAQWKEFALGLGFGEVESSPLARSSYHAERALHDYTGNLALRPTSNSHNGRPGHPPPTPSSPPLGTRHGTDHSAERTPGI